MKKFYLQWQSTSKMEINSREFEKKKKKDLYDIQAKDNFISK